MCMHLIILASIYEWSTTTVQKTKHMGTSSAVAAGEIDHRASSPITHAGTADVTTKR
jgi:hypothetical protein